MAARPQAGRVNQKARTRMAIVGAARELIRTGRPVTPSVLGIPKGERLERSA